MDELIEKIKTYKDKYLLTDEKCAESLDVTVDILQKIEKNTVKLEKTEIERLNTILDAKLKSKAKKAVKILDLIFRLVSTIMPLVVMLLCINGYSHVEDMVLLLAIGVACSSITILPRIEK